MRKMGEFNGEELEVTGGWREFRYGNGTTEMRFVPLKLKRLAHCVSCLFFNRQYESCARGNSCYAHSPICKDYVNRTHRR